MAETKPRFHYWRGDGTDAWPYRAFHKQDLFHELRWSYTYRFFGGAAGPGKTMALLWEAVDICHQPESYEAGVKVKTLLLRRTYPQLEGSLLREFRQSVPRELYDDWNEQQKTITWKNGATTRFGSMQYEKDAWNYQGHEYAFIGWDELTQFLLKQWITISPWNRCPVMQAGMAGAGNPVGVGAVWVRAMFVKKVPPPGWEDASKYDPSQYAFVPALISDNPIYREDTAYRTRLERLPKKLRDALLSGNWDVPIGAYFDIFDQATQVIALEELGRQPWWPMWISIDWGFEHEAAIYWHTTDPEQRTYTYREMVVNHVDPHPLAERILEASRGPDGQREKPQAIYLSPDAFASRTSASSIAQQMTETFVKAHWTTCVPAEDDRIGGWMLMYGMLESGAWKVTENCTRLIETLPVLVRDDANVEDVLKFDGDDPADGARYGLYSRYRGKRPPIGDLVAKKMTSTDPTIRAIQAKKALLDEKKRTGSVYVPPRLRNLNRGYRNLWTPR